MAKPYEARGRSSLTSCDSTVPHCILIIVLFEDIIAWLLEGDVSIQYLTNRDLLGIEKPKLQNRIAEEGWGAEFLSRRNQNGHWGQKYYQPKWISTHYTLLDLKNLGISPENKLVREAIDLVLNTEKATDGGILPIGTSKISDVCINGMFLNFSSYFKTEQNKLKSVIDFIISQQMNDGGFNCFSNRNIVTHSSVHTTLSILEGIAEYSTAGYSYQRSKLNQIKEDSEEFLLRHKLYRSHHDGEIISKQFLQFHYPTRWHYDILRAMEYFVSINHPIDNRMDDALQVILKKRTREGLCKLPAQYPGQIHFNMEKVGEPSRWNTLRALKVIKKYIPDEL